MNIAQMPKLQSDGYHTPERVTIHAMAEYIDLLPVDMPAYDFLAHMDLSAHYLITPSGLILQCLDPKTIGRHAGKGLNTGNVGVEILVPGLHTYATFAETIESGWCMPAPWNAAVELTRWLRGQFKMKDTPYSEQVDDQRPEWLVRHSDICPGRKVDPGKGFDWQAFRKEVYDL